MAGGSTFNIGLKTIRKLVEEKDALGWYKAKLTAQLFKGVESEIYEWVASHLGKYHALPDIGTLTQQFPEIKEAECPEPTKYYVDLLDRRFAYDQINQCNIDSQTILKEDKSKVLDAEKILKDTLDRITQQRYRSRIMNVGLDAPKLVLSAYQSSSKDARITFGWPYMDNMTGGAVGGDVVSFVGRPAAGKTWKVLKVALHNWLKGRNVLFASMEMNHLAIAQRIVSMYTHVSASDVKNSSIPTMSFGGNASAWTKFLKGLGEMPKMPGQFYVVDGNLAAYADDLYMLAAQLKCDAIFIDGAYLMRHRNQRLDRFTKVAENVELMKQLSTDLEIPTFASWQFNRQAAKKGKGLQKNEKAGLEDIGYSDAIPQVSSIVMGLHQEEGIETMHQRIIDVMKGRNGEIGQFAVHWDFQTMNFDEISEESEKLKEDAELQYA